MLGVAASGLTGAVYAIRCWLTSRQLKKDAAEKLLGESRVDGGGARLVAGLDRQRYGLSEYGFAPHPDDACRRLPESYQEWELTADRLPELTRTCEIRMRVDAWPVLGLEPLLDAAGSGGDDSDFSPEVRRAYVVLAMVSHSYVWCDASAPRHVLPAALAIPLHAAATSLGVPPVLTHAATTLWNHALRTVAGVSDASGAGAAHKLGQEHWRCLTSLTGTPDEEWFFLSDTVAERRAGPLVVASYDVLAEAVPAADLEAVGAFLDALTVCIDDMTAVLSRLPERCTPEAYSGALGPLLQGFGGSAEWPEGALLDGVCELQGRRISLAGPSAAQSGAIPVFDAVLGVAHAEAEADLAETMCAYMPARHREFLELLQAHTPLRQALRAWRAAGSAGAEALVGKFNSCLDALARLRRGRGHPAGARVLAQEAVAEAAATGAACCGADTRGTGAPPLEAFSTSTVDATLAAKL